MARHILPNVLTPVIVLSTVEIANMIIFEAGLSFLGLGIQPPTPSWGGMLADGRDYIPAGIWWPATFPGLAISMTVLSINLVGDWLRDLLDPRLQL
jgi:peptide/nickel transport system permease protein